MDSANQGKPEIEPTFASFVVSLETVACICKFEDETKSLIGWPMRAL